MAHIRAELRRAFGLPVRRRPQRRLFRGAGYSPSREQYRAEALLAQVGARAPAAGYLIAITNAGIYVPGFNFLFGFGSADGGYALVSLEPLRQGGDGPASAHRVRQRTAKIAIHEAGHALGLGHCREAGCVMRYSESVETLDAEGRRLRARCRARLRRLVQTG